ncbi:MAG: M28 family peptidase [Clostridiales bacterium]|nr:M28 family peptidase [Clostridiales bacterium]
MRIGKRTGIIVLVIILAAAVAFASVLFIVPSVKISRLEKLSMDDSATAQYNSGMPDEDTIYSWATDLVDMGVRLPGTEAGEKAQAYVLEKFEEFGLEDVTVIPAKTSLYTCGSCTLVVEGEDMECQYITYTCTDGTYTDFDVSEEAELVYVGSKMDANIDVEGKIVVADISFQSIPYIAAKLISKLFYDPDNTLSLLGSKQVTYLTESFYEGYYNYKDKGAAGYIGILTDYYDSCVYLAEDYTYLGDDMAIPGVFVSSSTGDVIKEMMDNSDEGVTAALTMSGSLEEVDSGAVIGYLPGNSEETIIVQSHYDSITSGAVEDASGTACLLAMADFYSQIPEEDREKTLLFIAMDTHFSDYDTHDAVVEELFGEDCSIVADLCVEHIAKEYTVTSDGELEETGEIDPRIFFVSGSDELIQVVNEEIVRHGLDRSIVLGATLLGEDVFTDANDFYQQGIALVSLISAPIYLYDTIDTADKIEKDALVPTVETLSDILWRLSEMSGEELQEE